MRCPGIWHKTQVTAKDIIAERQKGNIRSDNSVKTFGDRVFHRDHDGDTVATQHQTKDDDAADISQPDPNTATNASSKQLRFDLTGMEVADNSAIIRDDETVTMSTAEHTTGSTRVKLKQVTKQNDRLAAENENQAKELEAQTQANEDLKTQLAELAIQMARLKQASIRPARKTVTMVTTQDKPVNAANPSPANTPARGVGQDH